MTSRDDRWVYLAGNRAVQRFPLLSATGLGLSAPEAESAPLQAAAIVSGGETIVAADLRTRELKRLEPMTLAQVGASIRYRGPDAQENERAKRTFVAVDPGKRYAVVNGGFSNLVSVVDLRTETTTSVALEDLTESWGVAFDHTRERSLLAVNGRSWVAIYEFRGQSEPHLLVRERIVPQATYNRPDGTLRVAAIAWLGHGDGIVAATGAGSGQFRVFSFDEATDSLVKRFDLLTCDVDESRMPLDVVTLNDRYVPPTVTTTATATLTPTSPSSATPSATSTVASPEPSPTATQAPSRLYLPVALNERCNPSATHADVVLVLDASSSMRQEYLPGQTKWDAAVEAADAFIVLLDASDQAAVVWFNLTASVEQGLTNDKAALHSALTRITTAEYTNISLGIDAAGIELQSPRRNVANRSVVVVLTDGRANPEPPSAGIDASNRVKGAGALVFAVGLGSRDELDPEVLSAIATSSQYYYQSDDPSAVASIYRRIAEVIPCPPTDFWGRR